MPPLPPYVVATGLEPPPDTVALLLKRPIYHVPLIACSPIHPLRLPEQPPDAVLWTSPRAVRAVGYHTLLCQSQHWAVGQATAQALAVCGYDRVNTSTQATGVAAAKALMAGLSAAHTVWWPCALEPHPGIARTLSGCQLMQTSVYQTEAVTLPADVITALQQSPPEGWLLASPSAVVAFKANGLQLEPDHWVGALGPTTAQAITRELEVTPITASTSGNWALLALAIGHTLQKTSG
jgi:uroporphyrinogen-III synthase